MKNDSKLENIYKAVALCSATLILLGGLTFLLSWHFGYVYILKFPPSVAMLSYASSLNIVLTGLAIFFLFIPTRIPFTNIFGGIILLITFWRIAELAFNLNFGFTEIIAPWIPLPQVTTEKMPGIITIGFILIGSVLAIWTKFSRRAWQSTLILLGSIIIFLLGATAALNYAVPTKLSFIWRGSPINFYSQFIAMFIGIGLMAASFYYDSHLKTRTTYRLPIIVAIIIILFTILFSWSFALEKASYITENIKSKLNEIKTRISVNWEKDILLLKQLAAAIEDDKNHSFEEKKATIDSYLQTQQELDAIMWVGPDMLIRNIMPSNKFQEKMNTPFLVASEVENLLQTVINQKKTFLTSVLNLKENLYDLYAIKSVYWDQTYRGLLVFVIQLKTFFDVATKNILNHDFGIVINIGNNRLFGMNDTQLNDTQHWVIQDKIPIENLDFVIKIYPTPQYIDLHINKALIYMVLFGGFAIAISLGTLIHLWQLSNAKIEEIEKFRKRLLLSQEEQHAALESARMGTWNLDLKSYTLSWDDFTHIFLYGQKPREMQGATWEDVLQKIIPEDREYVRNYLKNCIKTSNPFDCSYRIIWPDESIHWLAAKGKFFLDKEGHADKISGFIWDITSFKRSQNYLEISETISKLLSENGPIKKTFNNLIQILHHYLDWSVMSVWFLDQKSELFQLAEMVHIPEIEIPEFEKVTRNLRVSKGMTIPGHVWATYRPSWSRDVTKDSSFTRSKNAVKEGLKGFLAFPILEGTQVIGVIELFKQKPFVEMVDEGLFNLITSIGIGIGQYIKRKSTEEAIAALASIVTYAQEGIYSIKADGTIISWNLGAERIFGWKASEMIGKSIKIIYPPDRILEFEDNLKKVLLGQSIEHFETLAMRINGSQIWVENAITGIKDQTGNIIEISAIVKDISKQREMLDILSANEKKFRDFVEATEEWFWAIDSHLKFTYSNPIIKKILGYEPQEIINIDMLSLLPEDIRKDMENQINHCIQIKEGWGKRTTAWLHKDGSIRWLESNAHPILDNENNVIGFRGADRDVTERKMIEKSKNEFISMVNHELRTPLTSILGALGIIRSDEKLTEKLKNLSNIAYRNSERLLNIINDILDIEKFELGKIEFEIKPISIVEVIDESIAASQSMAEKFNVSIVKEGSFSDVKVLADQPRLIQVIMNLLSNAVKFSPSQSSVFVSMQLLNHQVRVSVRDQGSGISEEFKAKVFTKFAQVDTTDSRRATGTGLGLNICKNLMEGMNGTIAFQSKKDEGTIFYFDLPSAP